MDGSVKLWDSNTGKSIANLAYHPSKVYQAVANADMTQVASVGQDRKIAIWDLRNAS